MVIAIAMVKDEADIVEHTVSRMCDQVDHVIVLDNASTDGTRDILDRLDVEVIDDPELAYNQADKMTALAALAAERRADWVIPFDADEAWYSPFGRIADVLVENSDASIVTAELYDHVATAEDPAGPNPLQRIGWRRRSPGKLPKVACRPVVPARIHQGNHGADYGATVGGLLVIRHFPYRSAEQFVTKARNGAAAINATNLPADQCAHWRQYGALLDTHGPEALHDVFRQWFWSPNPGGDDSLIFDPCPTACPT
jgi:glycosyltransferase involved in cell wall biosynthesis